MITWKLSWVFVCVKIDVVDVLWLNSSERFFSSSFFRSSCARHCDCVYLLPFENGSRGIAGFSLRSFYLRWKILLSTREKKLIARCRKFCVIKKANKTSAIKIKCFRWSFAVIRKKIIFFFFSIVANCWIKQSCHSLQSSSLSLWLFLLLLNLQCLWSENDSLKKQFLLTWKKNRCWGQGGQFSVLFLSFRGGRRTEMRLKEIEDVKKLRMESFRACSWVLLKCNVAWGPHFWVM